MKITKLEVGVCSANCYIVENDESAIVIDPGFMEPELYNYVTENKGQVKYILLTHRHFDHVCGVSELKKLTNAMVVIHSLDECGLYSDVDNLSDLCSGLYPKADTTLRADILLSDGFQISVDGMDIKVLHTPGHSKGGVCYLINNVLFSGDTLFEGTVGRTDFPGSSMLELSASLKKLVDTIGPETEIYSGHGNKTTLERERMHNPFLMNL